MTFCNQSKCCFSFDYSNGSVIANCTIQFQTIFINNVVIKHLFLRAIDNSTQVNGLAVNRQYTAGEYSSTDSCRIYEFAPIRFIDVKLNYIGHTNIQQTQVQNGELY